MMLEVQQAFSQQFPALLMNETLSAYINTAWLSEIADALCHSWGLCVMSVCVLVCVRVKRHSSGGSAEKSLSWMRHHMSVIKERQRDWGWDRHWEMMVQAWRGKGVKWGIGRVMRDDDDEMIGWGFGCSDGLRQPIAPPREVGATVVVVSLFVLLNHHTHTPHSTDSIFHALKSFQIYSHIHLKWSKFLVYNTEKMFYIYIFIC